MKTALLLCGDARFCKDFDVQLDNLKDNDIDYYIVLWKRKHSETFHRNFLLPPSWEFDTAEQARAKIEPNLPPRHRIAHIELVDPSEWPPLTKEYKHKDCTIENYFQQHWILKRCDQRRVESGIKYDLVIRSRPDANVSPAINLQEIYDVLLPRPDVIVVPGNHISVGYNDIFAIGLADTMEKYCKIVDYVDHFNLVLNVKFHSEIMSTTILRSLGISWPNTNLIARLRIIGEFKGGGDPDPFFIPDFGRWA